MRYFESCICLLGCLISLTFSVRGNSLVSVCVNDDWLKLKNCAVKHLKRQVEALKNFPDSNHCQEANDAYLKVFTCLENAGFHKCVHNRPAMMLGLHQWQMYQRKHATVCKDDKYRCEPIQKIQAAHFLMAATREVLPLSFMAANFRTNSEICVVLENALIMLEDEMKSVRPACFSDPIITKSRRSFYALYGSIMHVNSCSKPFYGCPQDTFLCHNSVCVSKAKVCDRINDCGDGSDELSCFGECPEDTITCDNDNQQCVNKALVCDGNTNCINSTTDEDDCSDGYTIDCPKSSFMCRTGICLTLHKVCDGVMDCRAGDDEGICDLKLSTRDECSNGLHKCPNERCIPKWSACDGVDDCGDKSDEQNCYLYHLKTNITSV